MRHKDNEFERIFISKQLLIFALLYPDRLMTRFFKVAGHVFGLDLPEDKFLRLGLDQYAPFKTDSSEGCLFVLSLSSELPQGPLVKIYDAPVEDGETQIVLYRQGRDWVFDMAVDHRRPVCATLWASEDLSDARLTVRSHSLRDAVFAVNNSMMLVYALKTASMGTLEMHASMVSNSGRAFLFLARSGTGKSTHTQLWLKNIPGSELMNDDNPVVRIWPDGRVIAYGSPWSGKTPCYRNVEAPVGAFVKIRRCLENRITPLSLPEAYAEVYSSCSGLKSDSQMADFLHESIAAAVTSVPSYVLDCLPDDEAARVCARELLK